MSKAQQKARQAREILENPLFDEVIAALKEEAFAAFLAPPSADDDINARRQRLQGVQDVVAKLAAYETEAKIEQSKKDRHRHGD